MLSFLAVAQQSGLIVRVKWRARVGATGTEAARLVSVSFVLYFFIIFFS